ncbi:hypothetical protein [Methylobacillus flagellatus]|uniref:Uncharacterized protein n=1 Tax=Methylobacillus flagellatus (strain ATCC 51484 / DSM 6875 / VKM B-1610 / KT) TaxID=265072 RepID=Q1H229_METFK|nr:hypothetical protein [Methylobacillus flagellatus]ABE49458.1 hypothetical protein Mfla_1190 [Methylobacillus flagellatus KT]
MKWIVIATDKTKKLFSLKSYSTGKYSVIEAPQNLELNFHDSVFGDFSSVGFRFMEKSNGQKFLVEVRLANVGMVEALKTTLSHGITPRLQGKSSPGVSHPLSGTGNEP